MQEIVEASGVIEERGFTIYDDLCTASAAATSRRSWEQEPPGGTATAMTLEENMTVVVQPNVVTRDHKAGVQVGELVRVTRTGFERLHTAPRGFFRAG